MAFENVLMVGAGYMAFEYGKALKKLGVSFTVVGRGLESCKKLENELDIQVVSGGSKKFVTSNINTFDSAIVAVNLNSILNACSDLIDFGIKRILVEKPAGMNFHEVCTLNDLAVKSGVEVFVAYNRRFYNSVLLANKIINDDGGVSSFHFDFTEWPSVKDSGATNEELSNWLFVNSSHVIDMAFALGGWPTEMSSYAEGESEWHPKGMLFAGLGKTDKGAIFTYNSNWTAPGRWGIEVRTKNHNLIFRPLEKLNIVKHGSVQITEVELLDSDDTDFKPGVLKQSKAFLNLENTHKTNLLSLAEFTRHLDVYNRILK